MSDIEDTVEVETNTAYDLIQAALNQNYTAATEIFNDQIGQRMASALDQEKINIASQIYNSGEDAVAQQDDAADDDEDIEISDEEIDEVDLDADDDEDE
tara:strand:+ start:2084 stop:2380 length:297 start_codon:yes stop_codon:yes gene_type:complete